MVSIDKTKCIGCGACAATCPKGFEMKGDKAS
ncbi:MAG: ferredoxin, partial [Proteobacteria bacterium]|nr:ferredoxin [Pseudomonadota bacterium]